MDFNAKIEYEKKLLEAMQQSEWDCKKFLNATEQEVQKILANLIKNEFKGIFFSAQTPFTAFINFKGKEGQGTGDIFRYCSRWYVDFLIVKTENNAQKPFAVIEYFGSGHNINDGITEARDNAKKKILKKAQIPLGIIYDSEDKIKTDNGQSKTKDKIKEFLIKVEGYYNNENGYPNENIIVL